MGVKQQKDVMVTKRFMALAVLFISCLLISNVVASKTFMLGLFSLPGAVFLFPITYVLGDLFTEVYGYRKMRLITWLGFAMNAIMVGYFAIAIALPPSPFYELQDSFAAVLGSTPRLLCASLASFLCGSLLNSFVLSKMKVATKGKNLAGRVILSTVVGELVDSTLFILIGFAGTMPMESLVTMIFTQACVKMAVEVILYPVTKKVITRTKEVENIDTFDKNISYNPFKF
jgi:uncharacterized integral membrane protein (TIGR00697 family)